MGRLFDLVRATFKRASGNRVSVLSAAVAFRIFLALVPSLLAGVAIFSLFIDPGDLQDLVDSLARVVPAESLEFIEAELQQTVNTAASSGVALVAIAISIYAAMSGASALVAALNAVWGVKETRNFVVQKLIALAITAGLMLTLLGGFVLVVVGPPIVRALLPEVLESGLTPLLIGVGRLVVASVLLMTFFAFALWIAPNRGRTRFRWITPGAIVGVVGWLLLSFGFNFYVSTFGGYSATYGVFAGIIILLVWLQLSFTVLLMGAELDVELEDRGKMVEEAIGAPPTDMPPEGLLLPDVPWPAVDGPYEPIAVQARRFPSTQLIVAAVAATTLAVVAWFVRRQPAS